PELPLPDGICYTDKDGHVRKSMRLRWFLPPAGHTYRTYSLQSAEIDCDRPLPPEVLATAEPYPPDAPPMFIGHYWLRARQPAPLAPNVACLDYSVARGGFLTAYRWQGERVLDPAHFLTEAAGGTH